ncbi:MAG TPA: hypothetical protein VH165_06190 [Kofleriaceae bacterium]|jgi:hypothetical protein|nr:hypothetical protein [Kofleriaceae bacterium]
MTYFANLRRLAEYLDRPVHEAERGSIATFNDLPPTMVEEVKAIRSRGGRLPACDYLAFFVATHDGCDVEDFCEEVLEGGAEVATWHIRDCLVGVAERHREGISLTVERYLAILDPMPGERWYRVDALHPHDDKFPVPGTGPGTLMRDTHYWTSIDMEKPYPPIHRLIISPERLTVSRIPAENIDVEIRRWMASVAAWWASEYLLAEGDRATAEGVLAAYQERVEPSADGLIAIRALVREARLGHPRWPGQSGYIGPDDWYRR